MIVISDKHKHQKEIFYDDSRFKVAVCGRRWGKTVLGTETVIKHAAKRGAKIFIVAPTREMVKDLFWEQLKRRARELNWLVKVNESELKLIRVSKGSTIQLKSADKPDRLRGRGLNFVVLDEYADMEKEIFTEVLRPALTDRLGHALFIGTPRGRNHFYELYTEAQKLPDWHVWHYTTTDSPFIDPEEIEKARGELDERTFRQEYEGSFESYEGRAYIYYEAEHHRKPQEYDGRYPVSVCCDFNLDPCLWIIAQDKSGFISFQEEIKQRQTDVWRMCIEAKARLEQRIGKNAHSHPVIFYGDYEHGKTRSVSATATSWEIIREEFRGWNVEFRMKSHPRIIDRVNVFNSKLRNAKGKVQLGIDPRCVEMCKDMEMVDLKMLQSVSEKQKAGDRTHASDAGGYFIEYEYPILSHRATIVEGA